MSNYLMPIPFIVFWVVLLAGRRELGWKGSFVFTGIWAALLLGVLVSGLDKHFFIAGESLLDVALITAVYIGFTRLR
jgi:hypothetical protein